ncbi:type I methionyl aminopeptidase [Cohnella sp. CFH 77786]|uniref:type I methionyl aminopeptidase n=1 Tax=Cohnella sp. CFH 77786 TaxID=2662265 RepID=UPI001C608B01|nr:type I methionyl aminopeptidase [Cohnella sp. CFH 77786]MBW5446551.1 type I methionyl aminopeptidase [Cohnella sp. CFH 77786]
MTIESENELISMRRIGKIVAMAREEMLANVRPGITTAELDRIGKTVLDRHGAVSAPNRTYGFPGTTCISLNHVAAHGIPGQTALREGDMVNIDVSAELGGYYADTGATMVVPPYRSAVQEKLCDSSRRALTRAIGQARAGTRVNQIGRVIEREAKADGFRVIRNLAGHGIGRALHEQPDDILNFRDPRDGRLLTNGLVLAVETFLTNGAELVEEAEDGWGLVCPEGTLVAQFEHTIVVTRGEPIILTAV